MPRWRGAVRLAFALLGLLVAIPLLVAALIIWAVRSLIQVVVGK